MRKIAAVAALTMAGLLAADPQAALAGAGLVPMMALSELCGLAELVAACLAE